MKILFVNIPAGPDAGGFGEFVRKAYVPILKRNASLVKEADTEIVYRFCEWGTGPIEMSFCRYMDHLVSRMVYFAAAHAEEEGFDAVLINCFGDPMLWEMRQALSIPVVGIGESAMLQATLMGYKFGIVHISPYNIPETEEHLAKYGVKDRCAGIRPLTGWDAGLEDGLTDARDTIEGFTITARQLIDDGAEVLVPACSLMSPTMRFAPGAEAEYPRGVTEIEGAPVVDVIGAGLTLAQSLVRLKRGGSSWIGRKQLFVQPSAQTKEIGRHATEDPSLKFWDVI